MKLTKENTFERELTDKRMIVDTAAGVSVARNKSRFYPKITNSSRRRIDSIILKCEKVSAYCFIAPDKI